VPVEVSLAALATFRGVRRRMEVRGTVRDVTVYDDFAHHPTAIAATIAGLRRRVGAQRILAVLEPRSNTMKQGVVKEQLPAALAEADHAFCYAHDLGWDAARTLAPLGYRASVHDDLDAMVAAIAASARSGDHVLVMSNGGFGDVHAKILAALAA
jgi:UDP-N-acetylmuramate: L-alanyl-gamma-D-glutamyl-meso-diaminopimelate ligase